jgi:hypothetical protein
MILVLQFAAELPVSGTFLALRQRANNLSKLTVQANGALFHESDSA